MNILFIFRDLDAAEPIGVMYISALLKKKGHRVKYLGAKGVDLLNEIKSFRPDIIGYSVCTGNHKYYLKLNRCLKKHFRFIALFGGPHPTFFPEMIGEDGVDIICRGEGELAVVELCDNLRESKDIKHIENLWIKNDDGNIYKNNVRPVIKDLDELPFPDRESRYLTDKRHRDYPAKSFITGRGCPFECAYCFNPVFAKIYGAVWKKPRVRSAENVVREIEQTSNTSPLRFVQFRCSIFPWDIDWLKEFTLLYSKRVGLPFYCHVRADLLNADVIRLMAKAGCKSVNMGIECGDEEYRKEVLNRPMSNQKIIDVCRLLHENNISILSDNILGLPGQSLEMDLKTFKLNVDCNIDFPLAMLLQPYPGTQIGRYCIENDYFDGGYDAINYNYYYSSPLKFKDGSEKRKIENFQKLFAITSELPWTLSFIKILIRLPQNIFFNTIFRCWYALCYHRKIMPFKLSMKDLRETLESLFGIYKKEMLDNENA
jgi:radical SAM superfamily enzyme YgiQ (UPF0313 family)